MKSIVIITAFLLVVGCAGRSEKKENFIPDITVKYVQDMDPNTFWPDKKLKEKFELYWKLRWSGKFEDAFKIESPYFQEMVSIPRYRTYIKKNEEGLIVTLNKNEQETERLHVVHCSFQIGNNQVDIADWWIYVGNEWYHVIRDRLVFPDES